VVNLNRLRGFVEGPNMSSRIQLFEQAAEQCHRLLARFPDRQSLLSIRQQLDYLLAVSRGEQDRSRLSEIIIGAQTAREVEPLSPEAAGVFYKVAAEVRLMQSE
jgi:hypothetical protein